MLCDPKADRSISGISIGQALSGQGCLTYWATWSPDPLGAGVRSDPRDTQHSKQRIVPPWSASWHPWPGKTRLLLPPPPPCPLESQGLGGPMDCVNTAAPSRLLHRSLYSQQSWLGCGSAPGFLPIPGHTDLDQKCRTYLPFDLSRQQSCSSGLREGPACAPDLGKPLGQSGRLRKQPWTELDCWATWISSAGSSVPEAG